MARRGIIGLSLLALSALGCGAAGASSSVCIVEDRYCYEDRTAATCMQIGKTEGDVIYLSDRSCAERGYSRDCGSADRWYNSCADAQ